MQTPLKYALGILAVLAMAAPTTLAGHNPLHAHGYVFEGGLATDPVTGTTNLFNACDDQDVGTVATTSAYDVMINVLGLDGNSFPATTVRAGDQGISSNCVSMWASEQGQPITIVANGCVTGAPAYAACAIWTKKAENLGTTVCFYDGVDYATPLGCSATYDVKGDLIAIVPAGTVYAMVTMSATSSLMSWWMYDGYAGY